MEYAILTFLAYSLFVSGALYFVSDHFVLKAGVVSGLFACVLVAWWSYEKVGGWPTREVPTNGNVAAIIVDEPNSIYVWVMNGEGVRSHVLPYTEENAQRAVRAQMAMGQGARIQLREPQDGDPVESPVYEVIAPKPLSK